MSPAPNARGARSVRSPLTIIPVLPVLPVLAVLAAGLLAAATVGCRSSGDSGSVPSRNAAGQLLEPDANGWVDPSTTGRTGIAGRWFALADTDVCRRKGKHAPRECSRFVTPSPGSPSFGPTGDLGMCTVGSVGQVVLGPGGKMDWENIFGASIGLALTAAGPYDAPAHGVTGFAFHIDSEPPPGGRIRVELGTTNEEPLPMWGGATSETSPVHAGLNEFRWSDVGGPIWVENPTQFDPSRLRSIAFHVATMTAGAATFAFCISRLTALTN